MDDIIFVLQINCRFFGGIFYNTDFAVRHKVLHKTTFFVGHYPRKIRLIIGKNACHQFNIWAVFIRQISVPRIAKFSISPSPLLFSGRNMMICHMKQTAFAVVFITAHKIILRFYRHIRSRHRNIFVPRNIRSGRIIYFVISAFGDWKRRNISFSVVENGINIWRKNGLIIIIYFHGWICPPKKSLRSTRAVVQYSLNF